MNHFNFVIVEAEHRARVEGSLRALDLDVELTGKLSVSGVEPASHFAAAFQDRDDLSMSDFGNGVQIYSKPSDENDLDFLQQVKGGLKTIRSTI